MRLSPAAMKEISTLAYLLSGSGTGERSVFSDSPAIRETDSLSRGSSSVCEFFDRAGMAYKREENILRRMWGKYMLNVGINQSCMVYGVTYGGALEEGSAALMTVSAAMREVILVANAEGVDLGEEDLKQYLHLMTTLAADNMPSMAQDRINKKPSEVDMFAGTVLKLAEKHGIPAPANAFLQRRVREIEAEY